MGLKPGSRAAKPRSPHRVETARNHLLHDHVAFPSPALTAAVPDDPAASRSPLLFTVFGWYLRWFFWRRFHGVRIARDGLPRIEPGRPLIIYTNHPSWWDPALFILLSTTILRGRIGFGPMDAAALGRYALLRRMGIFGIDLGSRRGAARFLDTSLRILADPRHVLWITAEGEFTDARQRPVRLRPGLAHLARRVPHATILPMAVEYTFWNESKPEALLRFGAPIAMPQTETPPSIAAWTALLEDRLTATMDALARDGMARDPARFQPVMLGKVGVGGIYDLWRRAGAALRGQRIDLGHEPQNQGRP